MFTGVLSPFATLVSSCFFLLVNFSPALYYLNALNRLKYPGLIKDLVRNGTHSYTNIGVISVQKVRFSLKRFANRFFIYIILLLKYREVYYYIDILSRKIKVPIAGISRQRNRIQHPVREDKIELGASSTLSFQKENFSDSWLVSQFPRLSNQPIYTISQSGDQSLDQPQRLNFPYDFFRVQEFAMVDVKTEGKERETDDLKSKLEEEGKFP